MSSYDLELEKAVQEICKTKAKLVCVQLPDGLKPEAEIIQVESTAKTDAQVVIWLGSCFGACDIPFGLKELGVDLLLCWGHAPFRKEMW
ncbi:hypothetical protein HYX12_03730 [Candidatus Woesearchaeota archaeon]|nr:hypothetical protein [Candidatus Woesearchaeota archaeon]